MKRRGSIVGIIVGLVFLVAIGLGVYFGLIKKSSPLGVDLGGDCTSKDCAKNLTCDPVSNVCILDVKKFNDYIFVKDGKSFCNVVTGTTIDDDLVSKSRLAFKTYGKCTKDGTCPKGFVVSSTRNEKKKYTSHPCTADKWQDKAYEGQGDLKFAFIKKSE